MSKKGPGYSINVRDDGTTEVEITATITEITLPAYKLKEISDRIAELEQVVADWKSDYDTLLSKLYQKDERIEELERQNGLLRTVADTAAKCLFGPTVGYFSAERMAYRDAHQCAVDGGALDVDGEK